MFLLLQAASSLTPKPKVIIVLVASSELFYAKAKSNYSFVASGELPKAKDSGELPQPIIAFVANGEFVKSNVKTRLIFALVVRSGLF